MSDELIQNPYQGEVEEALEVVGFTPRTQRTEVRSGIYRIWSQDRTMIYVGSTVNLANRRASHSAAILLGGVMEFVEELEGWSSKDLRVREDFYINLYKSQGLRVMNETNEDIARERGRKSFGSLDKETLRSYQAKGQASMTQEIRDKAKRNQWAVRGKPSDLPRGVYANCGKFSARRYLGNGKYKYLGTFPTVVEAEKALTGVTA